MFRLLITAARTKLTRSDREGERFTGVPMKRRRQQERSPWRALWVLVKARRASEPALNAQVAVCPMSHFCYSASPTIGGRWQQDRSQRETAMSRSAALDSSSRFVTEELANQWTHGAGFVLSLPAGWWLVRLPALPSLVFHRRQPPLPQVRRRFRVLPPLLMATPSICLRR